MIEDHNGNRQSPQLYARLGGLLYIVIIITGMASEFFFRGKLIVANDMAATARNIAASPGLWRLGILSEYVCIICTVVLAMIYFYLLTPVHKNLNILATLFRIVAITMQVVAVVSLADALSWLNGSSSPGVFSSEQLAVMANVAIKTHGFGYSISLLFLGCCFLVHGYLIFKSTFLPKLIGILIVLGGIGYMTNGFAYILSPSSAKQVFMTVFLPVFVAETTLSIWLLVKGVNVDRWHAMRAKNRPTS